MPAPIPLPAGICTWCGADSRYCNENDTFHQLLRRHDLHPWCWSGVGDGWLPLIDQLVVDLKAMGWHGSVAQIKEKFGALRFYAEDTSDEMDARIEVACAASATTCENCGRQGSLQQDFRVEVACDACAQAESERRRREREP